MYDPLNRSQSNPGSFKDIGLMKALKNAKQLIYIFHIKAHTIVSNEYNQLLCASTSGSDLDLGMRARLGKFNSI